MNHIYKQMIFFFIILFSHLLFYVNTAYENSLNIKKKEALNVFYTKNKNVHIMVTSIGDLI